MLERNSCAHGLEAARASGYKGGMPLYFAYGSNMDVEAMRARCPRSTPLGAARLARHRFFIMQGGYASVMRDPRLEVHGVLWDLALADVRALDAYEDVRGGLYRKVMQPVLRGQGASSRALVYVGASTQPGAPLPGYMECVLAAARQWAFPENYLRELSAFAPHAAKSPGAPQWTAPDGSAQQPGAPPPRPKVRPRFASPLDRGRE
jgi:gamma-glutamylcyclotransferase (GGCT)/AIG2-like uncharacterized protein YtfP